MDLVELIGDTCSRDGNPLLEQVDKKRHAGKPQAETFGPDRLDGKRACIKVLIKACTLVIEVFFLGNQQRLLFETRCRLNEAFRKC